MLRKIVVGPYQANCYILACTRSLEAVVIDPGAEASRILAQIALNRLRIRHILLTHGHMDHAGAASEIRQATGAPVLIHPLDASMAGLIPDAHLEDGQTLQAGTYRLAILHTPGHSPGGVCITAPGVVFSGDTLFAGSVGRTDFPGGSHDMLLRGVREKIFPLGDEVRVYPGHGPVTTVGRERKSNPFLTAPCSSR